MSSDAVPLVPPQPPEPPPPSFPSDSLFNEFSSAYANLLITFDLNSDQALESHLAECPSLPSITDSVTHIICATCICGLLGDSMSCIHLINAKHTHNNIVNGGLNVSVTGDLAALLDVVDIEPIKISVALKGAPTSVDNCITKRSLLPLMLSAGKIYYQTCFYCASLVESIISPVAVLASSDVFVSWQQDGFEDPSVLGRLKFSSQDGLLSMTFQLFCHGGPYYCSSNVYTVNANPVCAQCLRTALLTPPGTDRVALRHGKFASTTRIWQIESEVWSLWLGSPGKHQLDVLPRHVTGTPSTFQYHPF